MRDYRESVDLLTTRAVKSPRKVAAQHDLESTLTEMTVVLHAAGHGATANELLGIRLNQSACQRESLDTHQGRFTGHPPNRA
jgi:hypothetical protein